MKLDFQYNDGGRQDAGYKGKNVGDCVCRSIAIASSRDYKEVYKELSVINKSVKNVSSARDGVYTNNKKFKDYMVKNGFVWISTSGIGVKEKKHLRRDEVPMNGRIICKVSKHFTSVIDGVINDTYDPSREGTRMVYGYWEYKG